MHMRSKQTLELREMMKGYTVLDEGGVSDQEEGVHYPDLFKEDTTAKKVKLTKRFDGIIEPMDYLDLVTNRVSRRAYSEVPITLEQLSFLLWSTQGVKKVVPSGICSKRTVPSAGSRHAIETYLFIHNVEGLEKGVYHYEAEQHVLAYKGTRESLGDDLSAALCGQTFAGNAPVCFVWTAVPYRSEWRYDNKAQKYILLDVGHVCQNLYLSCEAMGLGTCAIAAYDQGELDKLLGLDTEPTEDVAAEFAIYAASVGVPQ